MTKYEASANMALFLLEKTGSIYGTYRGTLPASVQRAMFGTFLGKGRLTIDGSTETLTHTVKRCFGQDYEQTFDRQWRALTPSSIGATHDRNRFSS